MRLRYQIGPADNVLRDLHDAIRKESTVPLELKPLRQEFVFKEHTIVFENLFNEYDDEGDAASRNLGWQHG